MAGVRFELTFWSIFAFDYLVKHGATMPAVRPELPDRRARTREALLAAGLRLFAERPVDAVPIDDIVGAAGVAKGSFFNHFRDKQHFADVVAAGVRQEIEASIAGANAGVTDPLTRLCGGMLMAVDFALRAPVRARVMLRSHPVATARDHPLNAGLRQDIEAAAAAGLTRPEAREAGLLFWLGACNMLVANVTERGFDRPAAAARMADVMLMGLTGLGVDEAAARAHAEAARRRLEVLG
jgi:AcrR family transcriptional regulator